MEKEMMYVAPAVEVVEVAVEKGFAGSSADGGVTPDIPNPDGWD